jgi:SAM-dependent methyltransferase
VSMFDAYAAYYDLLYGGKDYAAETEYVHSLLPPDTTSVLELGCGTGGHAVELARRGLRVEGVDLSPAMVERARHRRAVLPEAVAARLAFAEGDARAVRVEKAFDAVLALFHVMSYQTGDVDLDAVFRTARIHLRHGGVFVFDFWHGPGVVADGPREVSRTVRDERFEVRRHTLPTVVADAHRVDVRFDIVVQAHDGTPAQRWHEVHPMRYLFVPELDALARAAGFQPAFVHAWLSREPPDARHWYAVYGARAV